MSIIDRPLTVAVSARSLFNLEDSHEVFQKQGLRAYHEYMKENEENILEPGPAFPLVKALLKLNQLAPPGFQMVDVIAVSGIHPEAGLPILKSIKHNKLGIKKSSFTGGAPTIPYLKTAFNVDLLLTRSKQDAQDAINANIAAALMYDTPTLDNLLEEEQIRIAFDGDAVLFTDQSERIYKEHGLEAFLAHETAKAREPLADGPFAKVLRTIQRLQKMLVNGQKPFRVALVTARGGDAQERVLRTFAAWDIDIDEAHFLSGTPKGGVLEIFRPHIFFDDQDVHVGPAAKLVPSALVPWKDGEAA